MKFKTPRLEAEFSRLHPEARKRAMDVDAWLESLGWLGVFITSVGRTRADMVRIYGQAGLKRDSWHLWDCAWDMRNSSYSPPQRVAIMERLREGTSPATHEVLEHDVGNGSHFHFAVKDVKWRKEREP
jgi:hypothetical protein